MLKIVQRVVDTPLTWYASRFNLPKAQVRLTVWLLVAGSVVTNLIILALVLLGILPVQ